MLNSLHDFLSNTLHAIPQEAKYQLKVTVIKGRRLPRRGGKEPSTFCKLHLEDNHGNQLGVIHKTQIRRETISPIWRERFLLNINDPNEVDSLVVTCWDHSMLRDHYLGKIVIFKKSLEIGTQYSHAWPLHHESTLRGELLSGGDITMKLEIKDITSTERSDYELESQDEFKEAEELERQQILLSQMMERQRLYLEKSRDLYAGKLRLIYVYNPPTQHWEGCLYLNVVQASELPGKHAPSTNLYISIINNNGERHSLQTSRVRKATKHPKYDSQFFFHLSPIAEQVEICIMDYKHRKKEIAKITLAFVDLVPQESVDMWYVLLSKPMMARGVDYSFGKQMSEEGWIPKLPIVLVPGFASSGLEVLEGYPDWIRQRIWLSISRMVKANIHYVFGLAPKARSSISSIKQDGEDENEDDVYQHVKDEIENEIEKQQMNLKSKLENATQSKDEILEAIRDFRKLWVQHMFLEEDFSDPKGIKVRPISGIEGLTYLDPGSATNRLTYVMGPLCKFLKDVGYTSKNLVAAPYDWRLPPPFLEIRDSYFSRLKEVIETTRNLNGQKVVILAHSMGNRVVQYFFDFVVKTAGQSWIDDHIHTMIAVGSPWLGSPKISRAITVGERMGLEAFLSESDGLSFLRTCGSAPCLLPQQRHLFFMDDDKSFVYLRNERTKQYEQSTIEEAFRQAGADHSLRVYQNYYLGDPFYKIPPSSGDDDLPPILKPPPVKRLYAIYGINVDTETNYFYKRKHGRLVLASNPKITGFEDYRIDGGIAYETPRTPQRIIQQFSGIYGCRSGDGSVPYGSLSYCKFWQDSMEMLKITELEQTEHREILSNRLFYKSIIEYVGEHVTSLKKKAISDLINFAIKGVTHSNSLK